MHRTWYTHRLPNLFYSYYSQKKILHRYPELFPVFYYHLIYMGNRRHAISVSDGDYSNGYDNLIRLIKDIGAVDIISAYYKHRTETITFENDCFVFNGVALNAEELKDKLADLEYEAIVSSHISFETNTSLPQQELSLVILNTVSNTSPALTDALIYKGKKVSPIDVSSTATIEWGEIQEDISALIKTVLSAASFLSFFDLLEFRLVRADCGWILKRVSPSLELPSNLTLSNHLSDFISDWERRESAPVQERLDAIKEERAFNKKWSQAVVERHRTGMRPYLAYMYEEEQSADMADTSISCGDRKWTSENGFFAYRIEEIGLNKENYFNYLSDYDYYWLNRINGDYHIWITNKLATRYAFDEFKEYLPDYYYSFCTVNGVSSIRALPDLDKSKYEISFDGLFDLLQDCKKLALKRAYGTHGEGFYLLEYADGNCYLNGCLSEKEAIVSLLLSPEAVFIVTEYVLMDPFFSKFYPKSLNTVRVNVFTRPGQSPELGSCWMRLGHSKGGYTDNINSSSGGIAVTLDKKTGQIIRSDFKRGVQYSQCDIHPDTGVSISGKVPNWDCLINTVLSVSSSIPQLEYLGFDVAVTTESVKIIEINTFPDYTKFLLIDPETQIYLKEKFEEKCSNLCIDPNVHSQYSPSDSFKISVVMPLFNMAEYVSEAIDSVINQSMAFKENIQLILINDGSTDNTNEICHKYEALYPNNIKYVETDNNGVSHARNIGIEMATGELITFLDGDDYWSKESFKRVWAFHKKNPELDVIDCRMKWFEGRSGYMGIDYKYAKGTRVVDIKAEPTCIQLSASCVFFSRSSIAETRFLENLAIGEDSRFVNEIILRKEKYGIVSNALYYRRFRKAGTSATQQSSDSRIFSAYTDTVNDYYLYFYELSMRKYGNLLPYIQYLILDAVRYRMSQPLPIELDMEEAANYRKALINIVDRSDSSIVYSLLNGAVGEKANMLRYSSRDLKADDVTIKGRDVIIDGSFIGQLNPKIAFSISEIKAGFLKSNVAGNITLPWFVNNPKVLIKSEKGKEYGIMDIVSVKSKYIDMNGNPYYNTFELNKTISLPSRAVLSFYLQTDAENLSLTINPVSQFRKKHKHPLKSIICKRRSVKKIVRRYLKKI